MLSTACMSKQIIKMSIVLVLIYYSQSDFLSLQTDPYGEAMVRVNYVYIVYYSNLVNIAWEI